MHRLLGNTTLLLSGAGLAFAAGPVWAQDATATSAGEEDAIVVVGTRLQNQQAIKLRRDSAVVVDTVTSDDIGRLPDFNIGEALQRLPGIAVQNDQGEARFVTVRAWNAVYRI